MPYCADKNLLFIHIPKTGGSSIEKYLKIKDINNKNLYSGRTNNILPTEKLKNIPLQHLTYQTIYKYRDLLNVDFNETLKIFTVVRNPYTRMISDLSFNQLIKKGDTPKIVYNKIKQFIKGTPEEYNNHNIPQYNFVVDDNNNLIKKITILYFENFKKELIDYGFKDFNIHIQKNIIKEEKKNYMSYLNKDSIKLINEYYKKDFELFGYKML